MVSPINISGLPIAAPTSGNNLMLIRQGLTDYQIALNLVQNIDLSALDPLPGGYANSTDLLSVWRSGSNYQITFSQIGFVKGTVAVFYQATAPIGWTILNGAGGNLLSCTDNITKYAGSASGGVVKGTWTQQDVSGIEGMGLNLNQIPNHNHFVVNTDQSGKTSPFSRGGDISFNIFNFPSTGIQGSTQTVTTNPAWTAGSCLPHNHGSTWRPSAACCILCTKTS